MFWRLFCPAAAILALAAAIWWLTGSRDGSDAKERREVRPAGGEFSGTRMLSEREAAIGDEMAARDGAAGQGGGATDWFRDVTSQTGIAFVHDSGTSPDKPFPAANGSGLGVVDFDCDGWPDLCFLSGTDFPIDLAAGPVTVALYRHRSGWSFEEVTAASRITHRGYAAGLAVGDVDSDGFPDLYVNGYGANALLLNRGDGTFEPAGVSCGALDSRWGTSAAFLDLDNDGLLEIYVCNYARWSLETNPFCGDRERGVRLFCSPRSVQAVPDALYRNLGDGRFRDLFAGSVFENTPGRAQGVVAADLNNDGWIDVYVGNDLHANSLLFNSGAGELEDVSELTGAAYDYVGNMQAGMGVASADVNRDGWFDLFVTNFENEHNAFYENIDGTLFQEVAHSRQLASASLPWVGWGTAFADFDLDGWSDLVVTNGHVDDNRHLIGQDVQYDAPALLWKNRQGRFERVESRAGDYFHQRHCGRALVAADLDRDGDPDLVIGHQDAAPSVLAGLAVSDPGNAGSSQSGRSQRPSVIRIRLIGTLSNRDAVGARLTVRIAGEDRPRYCQVVGGGSYLSAGDRQLTIAVPDGRPVSATVHWPAGHSASVHGLAAPGTFTITERPGSEVIRAVRVP